MANCDVLQCSLGQCPDRHIPNTAARVEVCTVVPSKVTKSERQKFLIRWSRRGEAVFHPQCWHFILTSVRARNTKSMKVKFQSAAEKLLVKEAAKTAERHDSKEDFEREAARIAEMLKSSEHCVAFTGAGISTSAGIGDYRGKSGKWTEDARAVITVNGEPSDNLSDLEGEGSEEQSGVAYEDLRPTYTHEALCKLRELGYVKYIISQNCDGLHLLSGVPEEQISELHGNVFKEKCDKCGYIYYRSKYVLCDHFSQYFEELQNHGRSDLTKPKYVKQCNGCGLSHYTGRMCKQKGCNGHLCDTIINFGDDLEQEILDRATHHAKLSDVMMCLGSTMTVTPACHLVEMGRQPLKLIICNRQKTALDDVCLEKDPESNQPRGSRVFGDCDLLMREVMKCLLSVDEMTKWESERAKRRKTYDKQRKP